MEDLQIMMAKLGLLAARAKFNRVAANVPKEKIDAILDPLEGKMWKTEGEKLAAYKTEVGDEMFATLSASPSFPELLTKWEAEYKAKVVEELVTGVLSILPENHGLTRNDVVLGFLAGDL